MIDLNIIRKEALNHNSEIIRDLLLNEQQVSLLNYISVHQITSCRLSQDYKISIQRANQKLNSLYKKGYLTRTNIGDPSGGNMYVYKRIKL